MTEANGLPNCGDCIYACEHVNIKGSPCYDCKHRNKFIKAVEQNSSEPIEDALRAERDSAREMVTRLTNAGDKMAEDLGATGWDTQSHIEWHALKVTLWNEQNALVTEWQANQKGDSNV